MHHPRLPPLYSITSTPPTPFPSRPAQSRWSPRPLPAVLEEADSVWPGLALSLSPHRYPMPAAVTLLCFDQGRGLSVFSVGVTLYTTLLLSDLPAHVHVHRPLSKDSNPYAAQPIAVLVFITFGRHPIPRPPLPTYFLVCQIISKTQSTFLHSASSLFHSPIQLYLDHISI